MIVGVGLALWVLLLGALGRAAWLMRPRAPAPALIAGALLVAGAAALLLRPHETVLGGEDPGAYLNMGAEYARRGTLTYTPALLGEVPPAARPAFYYGHTAFGRTPDACFWAQDADGARLGPWFYPAYPAMMSVAGRVFGGPAVLYVGPLLGLLAALALAVAATRLLPWRGAAGWTFTFFVLDPVIVWNARCPRAESAALAFLAAGGALLVAAWARRTVSRGWAWDAALGAACLAAAPFFHITAWYVTAPALALLALAAPCAGRPVLLAAAGILALALAGFVAQVYGVTDCYCIGDRLAALAGHPAALAVTGGALLAALAGLGAVAWRRRGRAAGLPTAVFATAGVLGLALVGLTILGLALSGRGPDAHLPFLSQKASSYFILGDFAGLARVVSWPVVVAAGAGWAWLWASRDAARGPRAVALAALLPAVLLTGWTHNYMMETRRWMIGAAPLLALCLAGGVARLGASRSGGVRVTAWVGGLGLLAAGLWGRTVLVTHTDGRGLTRFLGTIAAEIRPANGMALVEYSPVAAPLDHVYGVPLLGLDNEYHAEWYDTAEAAWATLLRRHPERPAFFLTPFPPPRSERFAFERIRTFTYAGTLLPSARERVPHAPQPWNLVLSLYRMRLASTSATPTAVFPVVAPVGPGNMGWRGFDGLRREVPEVPVVRLDAGEAARGVRAAEAGRTEPARLVLVAAAVQEPFVPPEVRDAAGVERRMSWSRLDDTWWVGAAADGGGRLSGGVTLQARQPIGVAAGFAVGTDACARLVWTGGRADRVRQGPVLTRWGRAAAAVVLPLPASGYGLALLAGPGTHTAVTLAVESGAGRVAWRVPPRDWNWYAWPVAASAGAGGNGTVRFTTAPAWNPRLPGYPSDLGVLVYMIAIGADRE